MKLNQLLQLCQKYNIPEDVTLMSDSGWECDETDMNGVYYKPSVNKIVFTQEFSEHETTYVPPKWVALK